MDLSVGETRPLQESSGSRLSHGFGGGLMVTCGSRNVGMPLEGQDLQGTLSHLPGSDVGVSRTLGDDASFVTTGAVVTDLGGPAPLGT